MAKARLSPPGRWWRHGPHLLSGAAAELHVEPVGDERVVVRLPALWGIGGVVVLLASAIYRLTPYALELARLPLGTVELAALIAWIVLNAYSEGYRAFHRMFSR